VLWQWLESGCGTEESESLPLEQQWLECGEDFSEGFAKPVRQKANSRAKIESKAAAQKERRLDADLVNINTLLTVRPGDVKGAK
jgi:hypothetical protein